MKLSKLAYVAVAGCSLMLAAPAVATAAPSTASESVSAATVASSIAGEAEIRQWMTDNGISNATQDRLIAKLASGQRLDVSAGVAPVSETTAVANGKKTTRSVYPDGSVGVVVLQQPTATSSGGISTLGIEGCTVRSGSGYATYSNCTVTAYNPVVTAAFKASYQTVQGGYDKITYAANPNIVIRGGSHANQKVKIDRGTETSSSAASASLTFDTTLYSGVGSWTSILTLSVGRDTAKVLNNL